MALRAGGSAPHITAFVLRESVALVSGQCGVPQWPSSTRPRLAVASPPAASLRGLGRVTSTSAAMYRRHSLHFCGRRARPLDFCWEVMALADCPATPATQTHRAARSDTLASRYALVSGTSPLSVCQQGGFSQCAQLGFAMRKCWGGTSPVLRKCRSVTTAQPCGARRPVLTATSAAMPGTRPFV